MGPLRILHTADWHLGHTLAGHARDYEHRTFLRFLVDAVVERDVDVVAVCGDVFDGRSPPGPAQAAYFGFLAELRQRAPWVLVVIIAGNHDSPTRLAATGPVLGMLGVHVVGAAMPGRAAELALTLATRNGPLAVAAVPYVRPSDLAGVGDGLDAERNQASLAALYRAAADEAQRRAPTAPLIVLGHAHVRGALLSPRSERPLFGYGGAADAGAVSTTTFPAAAAYVALGHLHLAQAVGARAVGARAVGARAVGARAVGVRAVEDDAVEDDAVRAREVRAPIHYCGSPIPLALVEASYAHSMNLVTLDGETRIERVPVPRPVAMQRFVSEAEAGADGPLPLDEVVRRVEALPGAHELAPERWPWLEIRVASDRTGAQVRAELEAALAGRAARLVRLAIDARVAPSSARVGSGQHLSDLDIRDVVRARYESVRGVPLSKAHEQALGAALLSALANVQASEAEVLDARRQRGSLA